MICHHTNEIGTKYKVWAQTQTTYIWGPPTILPDAEPALLNPYNQTIFWQIVAQNLVHSDIQQNQLGTFSEFSRHYEIIVFHKIVWQANNLQRYCSFDVTIPLWEDNQAADTFSQSSKLDRRPVSVGANDVINILGVVKRSRKSQYVISLSLVIRSSWIVIRS